MHPLLRLCTTQPPAPPFHPSRLFFIYHFSSVQPLSHIQLFVTLWTAAHQASLSITNSRSLFKLTSIESVMPSNHLILCCALLLLPSIFSSIRVFSNESVFHIRWPKYWSFSFSISPSNEYSGLIPFRIDWFDLLAVQGTLKSLLQHHRTKASIIWCSAFFIVQLSYPYMTTGKYHRFDYMDLCWQSDVTAFQYAVLICHWSLRKASLTLLAILWNSAFRLVYLSFFPWPLASPFFSYF